MRLLYWGDTPTVPTGFGNVALNILKRLYATGKYDIDIVGINYGGDPYDLNKYPYKIYPAVHALATDANLKNDVYGYRKVVDLATTGRYDVIFILNDLFIVNRVMPYLLDVQKKLPKEKKFEIVYYFPVDSPVKPEWVESAVTPLLFPVTYTKYGINECLKHNALLKDKLKYIYHGIDKNVFHPLSEEEIKKAKEFILGIHKDKYVVLNVNRNQARKDLHKTFASFKIFHEKYPNTVLFMLAQVEDVGGDLIEIAQHYGLEWDKDWICPAPGTYNTWNGYPVEVVNQLYNVADIVMSTSLGEGWGLCLKSDTLLYTDVGVKPLKDLTIENSVLSSDGTYNKVKRILSRDYVGTLYKITTWMSNTPIESSDNHLFYTYENGSYIWKEAKSLKIGDKLLFPKKYKPEIPIVDIVEIIKPHMNPRQLKNLVIENDRWKIQSNFKKEEHYLPRYITITPEFCRLIGLFLAEGSNNQNKKDSICFSMNKNEQKELQFIADMMYKYFKLPKYDQVTKSCDETYQGQSIKFYSSGVSLLFNTWFGNKSRNIRIPSLFLNLNKECLIELVYGMFLGDGHYSQTNYELGITTTSTNLAYALRLILARLGITCSVRTSRTEYKVNVSGISKQKLLDLFNIPYKEIDRTHAVERTFSNDDYIILPIKSIETEEGEWRLIDIEVDNTNDFVANNVIVHNCSSEGMATMKPCIFPNNTSLTEIIGENEERGYLVKSGATLNDWICLGPMDNNQVRPTIDVYDMADKLEYVYLHQEEAKEKAKRAYSEVWEWDTIIKQWFEIFDKAYNKVQVMRTAYPNVKRNDPCPCGSGKHYKNCCM